MTQQMYAHFFNPLSPSSTFPLVNQYTPSPIDRDTVHQRTQDIPPTLPQCKSLGQGYVNPLNPSNTLPSTFPLLDNQYTPSPIDGDTVHQLTHASSILPQCKSLGQE